LLPVANIFRKGGISQASHWKRKYDDLLPAEMFPSERTQIQPIHR
jgi:hypothetical protein